MIVARAVLRARRTDCLDRSAFFTGSSDTWASGALPLGQPTAGPLDRNCTANPDFCAFNMVVVGYCDGLSFTGDRREPLSVHGQQLYFRGRANLDAVVASLVAGPFADATDVLLSGCSAGALAIILHGDRVGAALRESLPHLRRYKLLPGSGFFLDAPSVLGGDVYGTEMQHAAAMQNVSGSVLAQEVFPTVAAPIFVVNSAFDLWQGCCVWAAAPGNPGGGGCGGGAPGYARCALSLPNCSTAQLRSVRGFAHEFVDTLAATKTLAKPGNGAFIHTCHTHCELNDAAAWSSVALNGSTTMQQAVGSWWHDRHGGGVRDDPATGTAGGGGDPANAGAFTAAAAAHVYLPCEYNHAGGDVQCNPTCPRRAPAHPLPPGEQWQWCEGQPPREAGDADGVTLGGQKLF